jgi:tetratricopeptide (TPR) repeat protein
LVDEETERNLLNQAEAEAVMAIQIDSANTLALANYAEVLVSQKRWTQALQYIQQAVEREPGLMDARRVMAFTYETLGEYNLAIQEYKKAIEIMPNYTYLYIAVGRIYRHLQLYDQALEHFATAANLNSQLGIIDPIPYQAIANTYAQMGEFFAAALNVRQALSFNPTNANLYGQLGLVYHRSRKYEGAIPALQCSIDGCSAEQACEVRRCDPDQDPMVSVQGLPLSGSTVVNYFTYGSVLAAMHRTGDDNCDRAQVVFAQLRQRYPEEPTVMSIVQAGEAICGFSSPLAQPDAGTETQPIEADDVLEMEE